MTKDHMSAPAQRSVKSGILTLDVEGWTLSVRVHDGGYEVSITEDGKCPASHYVRLDHEQADTLRDFMLETSPQAVPVKNEAAKKWADIIQSVEIDDDIVTVGLTPADQNELVALLRSLPRSSAATGDEILYAPLAKDGEFTARPLYPNDEIDRLRANVEYWRLAAERREERRERTGLDIPEARTLDAPGLPDEPQAAAMRECLESIAGSSQEEPREPDDADWRFRCLSMIEAAKNTLALSRPHGGGK